jgi:ABC-type nickel/cobalt efflux system permease component RcnA
MHDHDHVHTHDHDHEHDHGHTHDHGPGGHSHVPPPGASARDLIALGVSGGLIPCPDALTILLLSVPIGQIGFGLLMVSSFSLGLAAVLIAIGVLMVKARGLLERLMPGRGGENPAWVRVVPVVSAIIVVVLGVALMISAIAGQKWA